MKKEISMNFINRQFYKPNSHMIDLIQNFQNKQILNKMFIKNLKAEFDEKIYLFIKNENSSY